VTKGNTDKFSYLAVSVINPRPVFLLLEVNANSNLQLLNKTSQFTLKNTRIFFTNGCENSLKPCSSQFQPIYNLAAFFFPPLSVLFCFFFFILQNTENKFSSTLLELHNFTWNKIHDIRRP